MYLEKSFFFYFYFITNSFVIKIELNFSNFKNWIYYVFVETNILWGTVLPRYPFTDHLFGSCNSLLRLVLTVVREVWLLEVNGLEKWQYHLHDDLHFSKSQRVKGCFLTECSRIFGFSHKRHLLVKERRVSDFFFFFTN